jgi:hypothetical protein
MSGFTGVNLIDYGTLTVGQKSRLMRKLQNRKRALERQLNDVDKALNLVKEKLKPKKKSRKSRR